MRSSYCCFHRLSGGGLYANEAVDRAQKLEDAGDSRRCQRNLNARPSNRSERRRTARRATRQFWSAIKIRARGTPGGKAPRPVKSAGRTRTRAAAKRALVLLDLIAGDRAAGTDLAGYRGAGWNGPHLPAAAAAGTEARSVTIPGPLRSFARMAAHSADVNPKTCCPRWRETW